MQEDVHQYLNILGGMTKAYCAVRRPNDRSTVIRVILTWSYVPREHPATAAIEEWFCTDVHWKNVGTHLINETKITKLGSHNQSAGASQSLTPFGESNDNFDKRFLSLLTHNNMLDLKPTTSKSNSYKCVYNDKMKDKESSSETKCGKSKVQYAMAWTAMK